jgi:hypothetical protein
MVMDSKGIQSGYGNVRNANIKYEPLKSNPFSTSTEKGAALQIVSKLMGFPLEYGVVRDWANSQGATANGLAIEEALRNVQLLSETLAGMGSTITPAIQGQWQVPPAMRYWPGAIDPTKSTNVTQAMPNIQPGQIPSFGTTVNGDIGTMISGCNLNILFDFSESTINGVGDVKQVLNAAMSELIDELGGLNV